MPLIEDTTKLVVTTFLGVCNLHLSSNCVSTMTPNLLYSNYFYCAPDSLIDSLV